MFNINICSTVYNTHTYLRLAERDSPPTLTHKPAIYFLIYLTKDTQFHGSKIATEQKQMQLAFL